LTRYDIFLGEHFLFCGRYYFHITQGVKKMKVFWNFCAIFYDFTQSQNSAYKKTVDFVSQVIEADSTVIELAAETFGSLASNACLYVPENSLSVYRAADVWKYFGCIMSFESALNRR
jgi:hypothetical protein